MGEFFEQPGVYERTTKKLLAEKTLSPSVTDSLRVTEHGHTRHRISNRRFVAFIILWDKPIFPHGANDTFDRCAFAERPRKCTVEYPLTDVWLNRYKQWPVWESPQEGSDEEAVVG